MLEIILETLSFASCSWTFLSCVKTFLCFQTSIDSPCIMCVQYIGGYSVYWGYHEYIGEYLEYIGGLSWFMWGRKIIKAFDLYWKPWGTTEHLPMYSWYPPTCIMISLQCTEDLRCTHDIPPMYSWYPLNVLIVSPWCTHDIPPMYSWYPLDVLMVSTQCTKHPRCTHDIPRSYQKKPFPPRCTHGIPRCTEHKLYRVRLQLAIIHLLDDAKLSPTSFSICTTNRMSGEVLSNKCFIMPKVLNNHKKVGRLWQEFSRSNKCFK